MTPTDPSSDVPAHGAPDADGPGASAERTFSIGMLRGDPTPEELAALSAVVQAAYVGEAATAVVPEPSGMSAWAVSQRGLRHPLRRELGWVRSLG